MGKQVEQDCYKPFPNGSKLTGANIVFNRNLKESTTQKAPQSDLFQCGSSGGTGGGMDVRVHTHTCNNTRAFTHL